MRFEVLVWRGSQLDLREDLRGAESIELDVALDDKLVDIASRAKAQLGIDWSWNHFHFVTERDLGGRRYEEPYLTSYVTDQGDLLWTHLQLEGVTVADVVRTRDHDLFEGDPFALLLEEPLGGDGVIPGWDDLLRYLVEIGAAYQGAQAVKASIDALRRVVEQTRKNWEARHARPDSLLHLILQKNEWDYAALARLLGVSLSTCVELLESLGYAQVGPTTYAAADPVETRAFREELMNRFTGGNPRENRSAIRKMQRRGSELNDN